ncbi:hypothetical protein AgCh_000939 [Apium graveolens]
MGEVIVTLQDVDVLLGLPVDGRALIADDIPGHGDALLDLVASIFGTAPPSTFFNGSRISCSFFSSLTPRILPETASLDEVMHRIRELCKGCKIDKEEVTGCLLLLPLWVWERLLTLALIPRDSPLRHFSIFDDQFAGPHGDRVHQLAINGYNVVRDFKLYGFDALSVDERRVREMDARQDPVGDDPYPSFDLHLTPTPHPPPEQVSPHSPPEQLTSHSPSEQRTSEHHSTDIIPKRPRDPYPSFDLHLMPTPPTPTEQPTPHSTHELHTTDHPSTDRPPLVRHLDRPTECSAMDHSIHSFDLDTVVGSSQIFEGSNGRRKFGAQYRRSKRVRKPPRCGTDGEKCGRK